MRTIKGNYPLRGSVTALILNHAKRQGRSGFAPSSLCPPLTATQARVNCWRLAKTGSLRRVHKGRSGRGNYEPRYALP